jgi:hypothetical protein
MSPAQKKGIVLLVVVAVLALALALWSFSKRGDNTIPADAREGKPSALPAPLRTFTAFRPKLKLDRTQFPVSRVRALVVTIPAQASGPAQRFGALSLASGGSALVRYTDAAGNNAQTIALHPQGGAGQDQASIVVGRAGGQIVLTCTGGPMCLVKLD